MEMSVYYQLCVLITVKWNVLNEDKKVSSLCTAVDNLVYSQICLFISGLCSKYGFIKCCFKDSDLTGCTCSHSCQWLLFK